MLSARDFKFLTRLHYYAGDTVTYGANAPWCEHEVDYILFAQKDVKIQPNEEEVGDTRYVDLAQLQAMMLPSSGLLWSPWFRIIAEKFLVHWWADLSATLTTHIFVNPQIIYRCVPETGDLLEVPAHNAIADGEEVKGVGTLKQGAYGKVRIHKHSLLSQLSRPDEIFSALSMLFGEKMAGKMRMNNEHLAFCNDMLGKVSRSFAGVIRQLPGPLYVDIMLFYLVLRALDTVEDDMEVFGTHPSLKVTYLRDFHRTFMVQKSEAYALLSIGQGDERTVLRRYNHCVAVYHSLPPASQRVIADICKRMGAGMASFVSRDLGQGTVTVADYDLYCHYVAGLVGEGLSELFYANGFESVAVQQAAKTKANTMGLFLQKTNIIRDYLEDYCEGRTFWPQEIWRQYTKGGDLGELRDPANQAQALRCLNHMILNALECIPDCLDYMALLRHRQVFLFCAIPQVMAIATLSEIFNNPQVFTGVVKIRKGLAAKMIQDVDCEIKLHRWFFQFAKHICRRVPRDDPNAAQLTAVCRKVMGLTREKARMGARLSMARTASYVATSVIMLTAYKLASRLLPPHGSSDLQLLLLQEIYSLTLPELACILAMYVSIFVILLHAVLDAVYMSSK
ncbi:squalene synthase [archaeon]|nr:MAG: squalene synthase [archaeon]